MSARSRPLDDASRRAQRLVSSAVEELRQARISRGMTQQQLAKALGVSRSRVTRVESQRLTSLRVDYLARHAALVGLRPSLKLYPVGGGLRDAAQVRYITRFVERVGKLWKVELDVPIPLPGDLRAIDVILTGSCTVAVEVITRLRDLQAALRAAQLKQRDIGADRLVIVLAGTHANRRALREARSALLSTYDLNTQHVMARLARGEDPGRDAIIVLD